MGKTTKFFKSLFGFKPLEPPPDTDKHPKRRWTFFKSHKEKHHHQFSDTSASRPRDTPCHHHYSNHISCSGNDGSTNKHAVVVAAATAAAAEAAVAAAHAAVEIVRMTSRVAGVDGDYIRAAVIIQSYFRSYLARKALRALKGLVKLQALVRGHIQRKKAADDLRRYHALVRAQARALAARFQITDSPQSTTKGPPTPEKFEHVVRSRITKHNQPSTLKFEHGLKPYDERYEKILEMDATKPNIRRRNLFQVDQTGYSLSQSLTTSRGSTIQLPALSPSGSYEVNSQTTPLKYSTRDLEEEVSLYTTQNSPLLYAKGNGSMRVSKFTTAKSDNSSRSCLSGYSDHPNYMAYTESSRAKVRSLSAPRQRPNLEVPSTTKRYSVYGCGPAAQHGGSNLRDSFVSKAYPGSGRLDRLGMPVGGVGFSGSDFSGGYWN